MSGVMVASVYIVDVLDHAGMQKKLPAMELCREFLAVVVKFYLITLTITESWIMIRLGKCLIHWANAPIKATTIRLYPLS